MLDRLTRAVLDTRGLYLATAALAGAFVVASLAQDIAIYLLGLASPDQRIWVIDLDAERTLSAWLASVLLFVAATKLFLIGRRQAGRPASDASAWLFLAFCFTFLSADEITSLHEQLAEHMSGLVETHGLFLFSWVIPAAIACAIGVAAYLPLLNRLERRPRRLLIMASCLYVGGALGMEMVGGVYYERFGPSNFGYRLLVTFEETLELAGLLMLLPTLDILLRGAPASAPSSKRNHPDLGIPAVQRQ